jgi:hypothetical protein
LGHWLLSAATDLPRSRDVRFSPENGQIAAPHEVTLWANIDISHCGKASKCHRLIVGGGE